MIRRLWNWLRFTPGDLWFIHFSRKRAARLLRAERRKHKAEMAEWLPEASERLTRRMNERIAVQIAISETRPEPR